jgi:hypothetical protein
VLAQLQIERRERLVEQQHRRLDGKRAGDGDALTLAAGEFARFLVGLAGQGHQI